MKRRAFVASLAMAPLWLRRAFADASIGAAPAGGGARAGATATDRPRLVFVVPRDARARAERGAAFTDLLLNGRDRDLAPLALADVVCAPASDFGVAGEPLMLFVVGSTVRVLDVVSPPEGQRSREYLGALIREVLPVPGKSEHELAGVARRRYVTRAPRGARWGRTTMCGIEYEKGPPAEAVDCGMGHVGESARRFLSFYVEELKR